MGIMDHIESYLEDIGQHLPEKKREDIKNELMTVILDALEERVHIKGEYTEEDIVTVLQELGSPEEVAERYTPAEKYLIGPKLFNLYLLVVMISSGAVLLGLVMSYSLRFIVESLTLWEVFRGFFFGTLSSAVSIIGTVTITFALLEYFLPEDDKKVVDLWWREWIPRNLSFLKTMIERIKTGERINTDLKVGINESIGDFFFTLGALLLFNLIFFTPFIENRTGWRIMDALNRETLSSFRPFINTLWMMELIHYVILWKKRVWSMVSRIFSLFFSLASMTLLILLASSSLIDLEGLQFFAGTLALEEYSTLEGLLTNGVRIGLGIGAFILVINTVIEGVRLQKIIKEDRGEEEEEEESLFYTP